MKCENCKIGYTCEFCIRQCEKHYRELSTSLEQKLEKAKVALEFVVKESGTSTNYNALARTALAEIGE